MSRGGVEVLLFGVWGCVLRQVMLNNSVIVLSQDLHEPLQKE